MAPPRPLLQRPLIWVIVLLLAAAGAAAWFFLRPEDKTDNLLTAQVERGNIEETVSAMGTLQPLQYVDVGTQVTGQLKLLVALGDGVRQAQQVAEIDPTLAVAQVDKTKATLDNLQAQLADRLAQSRLAQLQFERNKALFAEEAGTEEAVQISAAQAEQTAAQVVALKAQLRQTQSQLTADEANLRYTKIYSPIGGTVTQLVAREGQTLVANQQAPTILRVADLGTMAVWAQVSEADVPKVKLDMPVYFNTLGLPDRRWYGKVRQILPTPDTVNNVVLYNVLFDVENPDNVLKPQMSAQVYFVLAKAENALLVPAAALQPLPKTPRVKDAPKPVEAPAAEPARAQAEAPKEPPAGGDTGATKPDSRHRDGERRGKSRQFQVRVVKDGQVETRTVTVGVMNRVSAQVLEGLAEGETVVTGTAPAKDKSKGQAPRTPRL